MVKIQLTSQTLLPYTVKFPFGNPSKTAFSMQDFLDFKYEKLQEYLEQ